jgi:rod shape-determining protein MreD
MLQSSIKLNLLYRMSELLKNIIRFMLLILLQVFVLNRIMVQGYAIPYLYMLFILLLPFDMPRWGLLICGLLLGLSLDMFTNTPGMHAAACVVMAYFRPFVMNVLSPQGGFETVKVTPSTSTMGWVPFMMYAAILTLIHHVVYFSLEIFDFHNLLFLLLKILLSALASIILVLVYEMLFSPAHK